MNKLEKLSLIGFFILSFSAMAQPRPPSDNQPAPLGGVALLAIAGAAYGAKKIYNNQKSNH